ncbi:MAG: C39 family peptidase [Christensenellaceae bacterium]
MAIDPITAKILAQLAVQAATDEQTRKRLLCIILGPIIFILILFALIIYLISSPFSALSGWLVGDEFSAIEDFQKDYGYNQSIGIYEQDYLDADGANYEGVIFSDGSTEVVYFNQLDERWKNDAYGSDKIGSHGCGPTAMSIVVSSLTSETVDPPHMAQWSVANGGYCAGNGSYHKLIPDAANAWGLSSKGDLDAQGIVDALSTGKLVVVIMGKGHFTSSGHFIVLRDVTSEGKILVADPASHKRSQQEWDLSLIMNEARRGAAAGGPYWAIGN